MLTLMLKGGFGDAPLWEQIAIIVSVAVTCVVVWLATRKGKKKV